MIITTILTTSLIMAQASEWDSVFGIHSGIMVSSDQHTGDTTPIIGDTILTTGVILPIIHTGDGDITRPTGEVDIIPIAPRTGPISEKDS